MEKKKVKQTIIAVFNIIIFLALNGTAFAISPVFGLLFFMGFAISIYNKDIRKKPWKTFAIFVGGLLTRYALGKALAEIPNYSLTLDFAVAVLMIIFIFGLGWKIKRS